MNLLWLKPEHYRYIGKQFGQIIIDNRREFIGAKPVYDAFNGYAFSQFKRMTHFKKYEGYMGEKRKKLVDKFGYDCKNACHLIRLLLMCKEFLNTGDFKVWFDGEEKNKLLAIKLGEWKLESVKEWAEKLFTECDEAYSLTRVPQQPNIELANDILLYIMRFLCHVHIKSYKTDL